MGFKIGDSGVQNVDLVGDYFERQHAAERKIDYGDDLLGIRQD